MSLLSPHTQDVALTEAQYTEGVQGWEPTFATCKDTGKLESVITSWLTAKKSVKGGVTRPQT